MDNNGTAPVTITGNTEDAPLEPNPVPAGGEATASHVIDGPATDQQVTSTVTIDAGAGVVIEESDDITAAACEGPEPPPDVTFTFNVTPSVSTAAVGQTVEYTYCGQNTSTIPLEVVRLVDDRLGVVIELPSVETVVAPGESICNTDVGAPVSYVVQESDAGSVIIGNAVVTVQTQEDEPRPFQATAQSEVVVVPLPPATPAPLAAAKNIPICHATRAQTNPYINNAVDSSSINNLSKGNGHGTHVGPVWSPGIVGGWGTSSHPSPTMRATSMRV